MTTSIRFLGPRPHSQPINHSAYMQAIRRMRALAESHLDALDYAPSDELLEQMERSDEEEWNEDLLEIAVILDPERIFGGKAA